VEADVIKSLGDIVWRAH